MCVMSAVTDHYQREWPVYRPPEITPLGPFVFDPSKLKITITAEQWAEYQRLKRAAAEIDAVTGQPDCVKPGVNEWEEACVKLVASQEGNDPSTEAKA